MRRRDFIARVAALTAAWPLAEVFPPIALAQRTPDKMARIGFLRAAPPPERNLQAFLRGLAEHGYIQGHNFTLVTQWGDGHAARLSELAAALGNAGVDVILTDSTIAVRAMHAVTATVPIVFARAADPYIFGLVKSLARPGGNITGFSTLNAHISGKTFEILKEIVPNLVRVATLAPQEAWDVFRAADTEAAKALAIELVFVEMAGPEAAAAAMSKARAAGARAVVFRGAPFLSSTQRRMIVDSATEARLPTIYEGREYIEQGGLISYVADDSELYRLAAGYVARILAGDKPGDLPIQQPTKFELVINLKTARALGIEVPPTLLARADEVIE
jgi:putative ABC transport system substrate-binding protein